MLDIHRKRYLLYLITRIVEKTPLNLSKEDMQDIQKLLYQLRVGSFNDNPEDAEARVELLNLVYDKLDDNMPKTPNVITRELVEEGFFSLEESFANNCHKVALALKRLDTLYQVATGIQIKRIHDARHSERAFIKRPEPGTVMDLDFWNKRLKQMGRSSIRVIKPAYPPLEEQYPYVKKRNINEIEPTPPPTSTPKTKRYKRRGQGIAKGRS